MATATLYSEMYRLDLSENIKPYTNNPMSDVRVRHEPIRATVSCINSENSHGTDDWVI